jgi:hypothetical protein
MHLYPKLTRVPGWLGKVRAMPDRTNLPLVMLGGRPKESQRIQAAETDFFLAQQQCFDPSVPNVFDAKEPWKLDAPD